MEKLTTGNLLIEQERKDGVKSLALPKRYIHDRGLKGRDTLYLTSERIGQVLIIELTEYFRPNTKAVKVISAAGYCRFTVPAKIKGEHGKGSRWEAYSDGNGLLRLELVA